jgi:hypothetical protein
MREALCNVVKVENLEDQIGVLGESCGATSVPYIKTFTRHSERASI